METTKISITRALATLKRIDGQFKTLCASTPLIAVVRGVGDKQTVLNTPKTTSEVSAEIQAGFDKLEDLLRRRALLKAAIVKANATNEVVIAGNTMTVAAAIERRASIELEEMLLLKVREQYAAASATVERLRQQLESDVDRALVGVYGNDKGKVSTEQYEAVAQPRRAVGEPALLDPKKLSAYIDRLQTNIQDFKSEVDFTLSEFNAKTEIEIPA